MNADVLISKVTGPRRNEGLTEAENVKAKRFPGMVRD